MTFFVMKPRKTRNGIPWAVAVLLLAAAPLGWAQEDLMPVPIPPPGLEEEPNLPDGRLSEDPLRELPSGLPDSLPSYGDELPGDLPMLPPGSLEILRRNNPGIFGDGGNLFGGELEGAPLEEQEATVRKALADLNSPDPEIRASACMILGKYTMPMARAGLFRAIQDPVSKVRRTALVAILENRGQLGGREAVQVLPMVADEDVHIRRLASSAAQMMMIAVPYTVKPGTHVPIRSYPPALAAELQKALLDEDLTVRRNMVAALPNLRMDLSADSVTRLLTDSDREIRLGTLAAISQLYPEYLSRLGKLLVNDPEPLVREELVKLLARMRSPANTELLQKLAEDPVPKVAAWALLAMFEGNPSREAYDKLLPLLNNPALGSEILRPVVYAATMLPPAEALPMVQELLKKRNPAYTADALTVYSAMMNGQGGGADITPALSFLEDPVPAVRQAAMSVLMRAPKAVSEQHLQDLMANSHADVREQSLFLARVLPGEKAIDMAMELILDEEVTVRVAALRELVNRRAPEADLVVEQSLRDGNPEMVRAALEVLGSQASEKNLKLLQGFVRENADHPLAPQATQQVYYMEEQLRNLPAGYRAN